MADKVLRIQRGHYARTRGSTGTSSPTYGWTEQAMNVELAAAIVQAAKSVPGLTVEVTDADQLIGGKCDVFIALHMDGSDSLSPSGGSFGHNSTTNSKKFVALLKALYQDLGLPSNLRGDNYTTGLSNYYGYKSSYAGWGSGPKIVFENGFLTNARDARWAKDNQARVAEAIVAATADYLGLSVESAVVKEPVIEFPQSEWYKIIQTASGDNVSAAVILLQERLIAWGFEPGVVDGLIGPATRSAYREWSYAHLINTKSVASAHDHPGKGAWNKILGDPTEPFEKDANGDLVEVVETPTVVTEVVQTGVVGTAALARIKELEAELVEAASDKAEAIANTMTVTAKHAHLATLIERIEEVIDDA